ncbi:MAG TPA: hypothetical protein PKI32_08975, partial [Opitutales bacterium]|nr:hypothetical protein [Opitutales bacterium]
MFEWRQAPEARRKIRCGRAESLLTSGNQPVISKATNETGNGFILQSKSVPMRQSPSERCRFFDGVLRA